MNNFVISYSCFYLGFWFMVLQAILSYAGFLLPIGIVITGRN